MAGLKHWLFASIFVCFSPTLVSAQVSPSELAANASSDARVLRAFQVIERAARQMDHYVAYSVIASSGGWLVVDAYGDNPVSNSYVIRNNVEDQAAEVNRSGATVARSKTATETEKSNAKDAVAKMKAVFDASLVIADSLESGDLSEAANLYRDTFIEPQEAALRAAFTGASSASKRLNKSINAMRLLK